MIDDRGRHINGTPFEGGSRGMGDTIAKLTHATGLDKLAEAYTRLTGNDCGCDGRRDRLNRLVPYKNLHLD